MHGTGVLEVLAGCLGIKRQWLPGLHQLYVSKLDSQVVLVKLDAYSQLQDTTPTAGESQPSGSVLQDCRTNMLL